MPNLTLVIGNKNYSSWSLRAWVFLKHHQIGFVEKRVVLSTETTAGELAPYESGFKVPILVDDDFIVWDSLAILEYISEKYLEAGGWPRDVNARAMARSMCAEMHSSFANVRNELPMNCRKKFQTIDLSLEAKQEIERIKFLWRRSRGQYGDQGEWLFGSYTIADAMFAPIALRLEGYSIPLDGVESDYVKTTLEHPGIVEWVEAGKLESEVIEEDEIKIPA